jgi:diphosphomevalonate decarboxylase
VKAQNQIWACREEGISLYFTQDAGPNLKLLFLEHETDTVKHFFPNMEMIIPFGEA